MRLFLRARRPNVLAARVLELGLVAFALGPAAATGGCGRIGYELLPEGELEGGRPAADAPSGGDTGRIEEASAETAIEAGDDSTLQDSSPPEAGADADAACSRSSVADYCAAIPPLLAPPVIDGVLDCGPALVSIVPEDWRGAAPLPPFPAGNSAEVAAAWRPDGLYVFMAVTTPAAIPPDPTSPIYYGAGVELFVDDDGSFTSPPSYDGPGTIQLIATSPHYASPDASSGACPDASADASTGASADASSDASATGQRAERWHDPTLLGPWTSTQFGTFATPGGFVFEGFIVATDLGLTSWSLAAGGKVGFDVAVDVSFPNACTTGLEGHRAGQYFLHVTTTPPDAGPDAASIGPPFVDVRSFCTPTLTPM